MKSHSKTVLLIEQDPIHASDISKLFKEIFQKVYVCHSADQGMKEFLQIKPHLIFFNLSVKQRDGAFEMIERLPFLIKKDVLMLGYSDASTPELLAHTMEKGIQEVYPFPFRSNELPKKINLNIESHHQDRQDDHVVKLSNPIPVKVRFKLKLLAIDESGLTLTTNYFISKGTTFDFQNPLITEIFGEEIVSFRVTKTWLSQDTQAFHLFIEPAKPNEATSNSLRKYILRMHETGN